MKSALLSYDPPNSDSTELYKKVWEMQLNLLSNIRNYETWDVYFDKCDGLNGGIGVRDLFDNFIGRKAHVGFLDDHKLSDTIILMNNLHI